MSVATPNETTTRSWAHTKHPIAEIWPPTERTMDNNSNTPLQEAISLITIMAMLIAVGCYCAELYNVPVLAPYLFRVAGQLYQLFPALNGLPGSQAPMLVGAAVVGVALFIFTIPLAYSLAAIFSRQGIQSLERQTLRLKTHRERVRKRYRNRDTFYVR
jgi:hypothetical protein